MSNWPTKRTTGLGSAGSAKKNLLLSAQIHHALERQRIRDERIAQGLLPEPEPTAPQVEEEKNENCALFENDGSAYGYPIAYTVGAAFIGGTEYMR